MSVALVEIRGFVAQIGNSEVLDDGGRGRVMKFISFMARRMRISFE
jgi:hypothetical protein